MALVVLCSKVISILKQVLKLFSFIQIFIMVKLAQFAILSLLRNVTLEILLKFSLDSSELNTSLLGQLIYWRHPWTWFRQQMIAGESSSFKHNSYLLGIGSFKSPRIALQIHIFASATCSLIFCSCFLEYHRIFGRSSQTSLSSRLMSIPNS